MNELMPCPFCGNAKNLAMVNEKHDHSGGYFIACPECGASTIMRYAMGDDPKPLLIEAWNRRAALSAQPGAVGERWPNVESAMEDPLFQRARAIMGTENWFQDNALRNVVNYVLGALHEVGDTKRRVEAPSDDELIQLAREHTGFNGSHALTNYPAFARAVLDRYTAPLEDAVDTELLDWLEAQINEHGAIHLHDGKNPDGYGLGLRTDSLNRTLRDAIQKAISAKKEQP